MGNEFWRSITKIYLYQSYSTTRMDNPLLQFSCEIVKICRKIWLLVEYLYHYVHYGTILCSLRVIKPLKNSVWQQYNIKQVGQMIRNGNAVPFQELKMQFRLKASECLSYLQIKSIITLLLCRKQEGLRRHINRNCWQERYSLTMYRLLCSATPDSNFLNYNGNVT